MTPCLRVRTIRFPAAGSYEVVLFIDVPRCLRRQRHARAYPFSRAGLRNRPDGSAGAGGEHPLVLKSTHVGRIQVDLDAWAVLQPKW